MLDLCKVKAKLNKNKYNSKNLLSILKDDVERSIGAAKSSNGMLVFSDCVVPFSELILQFNHVKDVQVVWQTVRSFSWNCANLVSNWAGDLAWRWKVWHFLEEKSIM